MHDLQAQRHHMVETQLIDRGIRDDRVLRAMRIVPREKFVPAHLHHAAYHDQPLPIGAGQTISQPFIVAVMIEALNVGRDDIVLEVGAGSGYAAAVLSELTDKVFAIERIRQLAEQARANLSATGYGNVNLRIGDGSMGWPEAAPFDAILVSAGAPDLPHTLKEELRIGGRMIVPIGASKHGQVLIRVTRVDDSEFKEEDLGEVRFVPLIGTEGWHQGDRGFIPDNLVSSIE